MGTEVIPMVGADEWIGARLPHLLDPKSDWEWQTEAACLSYPELSWFAPKPRERNKCKTICATCVVKANCLDFATRNQEHHGIWGGLDAQERKQS